MKTPFAVAIYLLACGGVAGNGQSIQSHAGAASRLRATSAAPKAVSPALAANYGKLPLSFEANLGQSDPRVKFLSRGNGYSLFLTDSAAVLALTKGDPVKNKRDHLPGLEKNPVPAGKSAKTDVIRLELAGAPHSIAVSGVEQLPGTANYFIGSDPAKWHSNVPTYAKVKYAGVYPGVDLVYYGSQRQLEYDFVVAPGADAKSVKLRFAGATKLKLNAVGGMEVITRDGEIAFRKPVVYQVKDGYRVPVEGRFTLQAGNKMGFALGSYDHTRELIIDPVLEYSTYLGGSSYDTGVGIAADAAGNAYVTGYTGSTDFPVTPGSFQTVNNGGTNGSNAFITKLDSAGTALVYSTYLGGSGGYDTGAGIAVDSAGNAYVAGYAYSTNFPVTSGAFQTANNGGANRAPNGFITKLNSTGTALIYSTYLGGSGLSSNASPSTNQGDYADGIAVDASGDAYVTGSASSANFPVTVGAFQTVNNAAANQGSNAFITKLNPTGTSLTYSTYLGGSGSEFGYGIAADMAGSAYVTGDTFSNDFPVTSGAFQTVNQAFANSTSSIFITKINPQGTALAYSTYLGGSSYNDIYGIAVDAADDAYVAGDVESTDFPVTAGAFQAAINGSSAAIITKLNPAGTALIYSTYLGGSDEDYGYAIALDAAGDAYVTGDAFSTDFPVTPGAFQTGNNGAANGNDNSFVTELNPGGTGLIYSTYLGGSDGDFGNGIAVDASGNIYVAGQAYSFDFPITSGAFQTVNESGETAFVAKFAPAATTLIPTSTAVTSSGSPAALNATVVFTAAVTPLSGNGTPTGTVGFSVSGGPATNVTLDGTGHAQYSINTLPLGSNPVIATYSGDTNYAPSSGTVAQAIYGAPANIYPGGSGQTAQVGSVFTYPLTANVVDAAGNPVPGVVVNFSGTGVGLSASSATTDSFGSASVIATATAVGSLSATAIVSGTTIQATFTLTGTEAIGLQFVPATPCRVVDTRNATGPFGGPELAAGTSREFDIPNSSCGIPSTAVAYSLNVTVVPNAALNYLTLWPSGEAQPFVSTLNSDGRVKANAAITPAGVYGGVSVFVSDASQVILDIDGYFLPASESSGLAFYPVTPCRIADTRNPAGPLGGPFLAGGTSRNFPVQSSSCGLPAEAQAYSLNVTAAPHSTLNYLTTWPTGETQPYVSTLNSSTGAVTANAAIVPAGTSGDVSIFVYDDADVILDVNGYFAPPASGGLSLYTVAPCRVLDTRPNSFNQNAPLVVSVERSACAPPSTAEAYVLNATVVPVGALNYLTLWPDGGSQPYVSTLNADDGAVTSNMAIVPTNNGAVDAFADGTTNLILDISSYFAP